MIAGKPTNAKTPPLQRGLRSALLVLLLVYPLTLHLGILEGWLLPAVAILLALVLLSALLMLGNGNRSGWLLLLASLGMAVWLTAMHGNPRLLLRLPPVAINGILCILFGATLLAGQKPLITRFAETMHGHALDAAAQRYTRGVTILWTTLFALMMTESALLALLASPETWSLFTNFINYVVVLLVFFLEYRLRIRRLPQLQHPGFAGFLLALSRIDWRKLL
jgi:uncharacterized membrane protein